jgi:hypothetical protein
MKMLRTLLTVLVFTALAPATGALAAVATGTVEAPHMDIQLWPDEQTGQSAIVAVAQVPTDTPLPAKISLPLPKGAVVTWSGEIYSGGPQNDVQRKFTLVQGSGGQNVEFTTERSRVVQYEATWPGSTASGDRLVSKLPWVQSAPAGTIQFGFKLPPGAADVQSDPPYMGKPAYNDVGESLYSVPPRKLTLGAALGFSVSYKRKAAGTAGTGSVASATGVVLPVLIGLLAVVLAALLVVVYRQKAASAGDEEE